MGDYLRADKPPQYVLVRSTQLYIFLGSLNRVPALIGGGKSGNVTSAGWQKRRVYKLLAYKFS